MRSSASASPRLKAWSWPSLPARRSRGHSVGHVLVDRQAAVGFAGHPGLGRRDPRPLARVGVPGECLGAREIALRHRMAVGGIHRQHEVGRHHRQHRATLFLVGGGHEHGQSIAEAQPLVSEEIERGDGFHAGVADLQPLTVARHACTAPCPRFPLPELRTAWHGWAKDEKTGREETMKRRRLLGGAAASAGLVALSQRGHAQTFPDTARAFRRALCAGRLDRHLRAHHRRANVGRCSASR